MGFVTVGTLTCEGYYPKQKNPKIQIIAVKPSASAVLIDQTAHHHNLQGIGADFVPDVLPVAFTT